MALRRGFSVRPGERLLVVEDVITTGGSVSEVIDVVRKAGGVVAGVGVAGEPQRRQGRPGGPHRIVDECSGGFLPSGPVSPLP